MRCRLANIANTYLKKYQYYKVQDSSLPRKTLLNEHLTSEVQYSCVGNIKSKHLHEKQGRNYLPTFFERLVRSFYFFSFLFLAFVFFSSIYAILCAIIKFI